MITRTHMMLVLMVLVAALIGGCRPQPKEVIHVHETYEVDNSKELHVLSDAVIKILSDNKLLSDNETHILSDNPRIQDSNNQYTTTNDTTNNLSQRQPVSVPVWLLILGMAAIFAMAVMSAGGRS